MKKLLTFAAIFIACTALYGNDGNPAPYENLPQQTFRFRGQDRIYYLYIPEGMPKGAPLLFFLHGYGNTNPSSKGFCAVAQKEKFAVCIPWAAVDTYGKHGWNVGYNIQKGYKTDDIAFIMALARKLQKEYGLSRRNVFVSGNSNGGEMCYLFAFRKPDFARAVAPTSGLTMKWMYDSMRPRKAVPLLEVHGTEDRTSEWNGLPQNEKWGPYISVPLAVANWAIAAKCDHETTEYLPLTSPDAHQVIAHKFSSETNGGIQVQLYEVVGCGHRLSTKDFNYHQVIWDFFKQYIIP